MIKYIRAISHCAFKIIYSYFSWLLEYSRHPEKYPIEERFRKVQNLIRYVLNKFHLLYDTNNFYDLYKQRKNNQNILMVSNHNSIADPLVIIANAKTPVTFVAKKETIHYPFIGRIIRALDGYFLDRKNLKEEFKTFEKIQYNLKNYKNLDIVIYPEGTRNKHPLNDLLDFHHGTIRPAFKENIDIAVIATYGSFRILSTKYKNKYNPIQLKFIKIIDSNEYANKNTKILSIETRELINNEVKTMIPRDKELMIELNKKYYLVP